jgi:quercetin dioxygenase-like cupin family protein
MNRITVLSLSVALALLAGLAAPSIAQSPAASQPATYMTAAELAAALKKATEANPDMSSARVQNTDQYRINIVRRGKGAGAMAHQPGTEVHYIIEGAGTLATGGHLVRAAARGGQSTIDGGQVRRVAKGDVILIPENTPHWYKDVEGSITYLEVRFNVPVK